MKNLPRAVAVMLRSPERERFQSQARACFQAQAYQNCCLVELDARPGVTIGEMRNEIIRLQTLPTNDIIVHWDDDDWSHPNRIAEQVQLLQATGGDCVGYNEMLFWRGGEPPRYGQISQYEPARLGEAWLYSNPNPSYALGTSLCYWREVWEGRPFPHLQHGEDTEWLRWVRAFSVSANERYSQPMPIFPVCLQTEPVGPRMIARIHSGNSSSAYDPIEMARHNVLPERQWSRVPEWDDVCRKVMEG